MTVSDELEEAAAAIRRAASRLRDLETLTRLTWAHLAQLKNRRKKREL